MTRHNSGPFTQGEWSLFDKYLNYIEAGLNLAYRLSQEADESKPPPLQVSERETAVRWYATDMALLHALVYRAAGLRTDDKAPTDPEVKDLADRLAADHPWLWTLRNALFAHPPFVDSLFDTDDEVLFFSTGGIHVTQVGGGPVETLVDPFGAHMRVPDRVAEFRQLIHGRMSSAPD